MNSETVLAIVAVINAVFVGLVSLISAIGQLQRNRGITLQNGAPAEVPPNGPTLPH